MMFIAYVTPQGGNMFRLPLTAADLAEARSSVQQRAAGLLGRIPFTYSVRPA
jgi:hypothetical protein